jgi:hypothetical protein
MRVNTGAEMIVLGDRGGRCRLVMSHDACVRNVERNSSKFTLRLERELTWEPQYCWVLVDTLTELKSIATK